MYSVILAMHIAAAALLVLGTAVTFVGAWLRRGNVQASKWGLLTCSVVTVLSGGALVLMTGQGMGRVCALGTVLLLAAWGAYGLMQRRLPAPVLAG